MEFTGRITADAKISTVNGEKEVVNFTVALNERYRPKGATEAKEFTTYINVAWWMGTGIAKILRKGAIVTVTGRLFTSAYNDLQGKAKASINCHAKEIHMVQGGKKEQVNTVAAAELTEPLEDLPF